MFFGMPIHRVVAGDRHHAEAAQRVLAAVVLAERELQVGRGVAANRFLGQQYDRVIRAELGTDRPAGVLFAVKGVFGREAVLLHVGIGVRQLHALLLAEFVAVGSRHAKLAQHEIAVARAPWSFAAQRLVRQRLDAKAGHFRQVGAGDNRHHVRVGVLTSGQIRTVGKHLELRAGLGRDVHQLDRVELERLAGLALELFLPRRHCGGQRLPRFGQLWLQLGQLGRGLLFLVLPFEQRLADQRHFGHHLVAVVEEREQLIELVVRDRIVLVRVTLGAADGEPQPNAAGGGHAVEDRLDAPLLLVGAPFGIGQRLPMKRRRQPVVGRGAGQQVAGQLFDRKAVQRQVVVHRLDHPIAIAPGIGPRVVFLIAVGVGIAGHVQPVAAPALTEVR